MPPQLTITSPPLPRFDPSPTLLERQNIVTLSVTDTPTPAATAKAASFPFAVAIPALIGGMALAVFGALMYLYCVRRKKRKRRVSGKGCQHILFSVQRPEAGWFTDARL